MWLWANCNASAIQAVAAIAIAFLTFLTLIILAIYAIDTKKIARASVAQVENSQMPFLAVRQQENIQGQIGGWVLENQGFGAALNITYKYHHNGQEIVRQMYCLAPKILRSLQNDFSNAVGSLEGFDIQYESLSGKKYKTFISWEAGLMRTEFSTVS